MKTLSELVPFAGGPLDLRFKVEPLQRLIERADGLLLGNSLEALQPDKVGPCCRRECLSQVGFARSWGTLDQDRLLHLGREPDDLHQNGVRRVACLAESCGDVLRCCEHLKEGYGAIRQSQTELFASSRQGIFVPSELLAAQSP